MNKEEILTVIVIAYDISNKVEVKFDLGKKIVEDKDKALKNLYIVTKNNEKN